MARLRCENILVQLGEESVAWLYTWGMCSKYCIKEKKKNLLNDHQRLCKKKKTTLKQVKSYLFDYIDIVIYCPLTYYLL